MIHLTSLKIAAFVLAASLVLCITAAAQETSNNTNYDVVLQLVVGSNAGAAKGELPQNLSAVTRQIRSDFEFSNYKLTSTFIGRLAINGQFEYQSVADINGQGSQSTSQTFIDWSLRNLHAVPQSRGLQADSFRFGARVPVVVGERIIDGGGKGPVINYEQIGINLVHVGISENTPTLIGTLRLPGQDGTVFLVMTIRPTVS
ncbi:MAG: hypothetical protein ACJ73D_02575 [Pyrinomonadaceae bacterium]